VARLAFVQTGRPSAVDAPVGYSPAANRSLSFWGVTHSWYGEKPPRTCGLSSGDSSDVALWPGFS
jgi:hypothetical protein